MKERSKYYIYYHIDPRNRLPKYIGKGSGRRAFQLRRRNTKHLEWIQELKQLGLEPIIEIGNRFEDERVCYKIEKKEIALVTKLGVNLLNISAGGLGWGGRLATQNKQVNARHRKSVICLNSGKTYTSIKEAAKKLNIDCRRITDVLRARKKRYKGLKFRYADPKLNEKYDLIRYQKATNKQIGNAKKIRCLDTDRVFDSYSQLARSLSISSGTVTYGLKHNGGVIKGFRYKEL